MKLLIVTCSVAAIFAGGPECLEGGLPSTFVEEDGQLAWLEETKAMNNQMMSFIFSGMCTLLKTPSAGEMFNLAMFDASQNVSVQPNSPAFFLDPSMTESSLEAIDVIDESGLARSFCEDVILSENATTNKYSLPLVPTTLSELGNSTGFRREVHNMFNDALQRCYDTGNTSVPLRDNVEQSVMFPCVSEKVPASWTGWNSTTNECTAETKTRQTMSIAQYWDSKACQKPSDCKKREKCWDLAAYPARLAAWTVESEMMPMYTRMLANFYAFGEIAAKSETFQFEMILAQRTALNYCIEHPDERYLHDYSIFDNVQIPTVNAVMVAEFCSGDSNCLTDIASHVASVLATPLENRTMIQIMTLEMIFNCADGKSIMALANMEECVDLLNTGGANWQLTAVVRGFLQGKVQAVSTGSGIYIGNGVTTDPRARNIYQEKGCCDRENTLTPCTFSELAQEVPGVFSSADLLLS